MDIVIDPREVRRQWLKRIVVGIVVLVAALFLVGGLRNLLAPSVRLSAIRTAVVDRGPVSETLSGSGIVVPAFEQVISCPFDTRLLSLAAQPGTALDSGDVIARLDDRDVSAEVSSLSDQIQLKQNQREQLEVDLSQQLAELEGELAILRQRIEYLAAKTEQQKELLKHDVATVWAVRQAELDESIERIRLEQTETRISRLREATLKQIEGLDIEMRLLRQQQFQAKEQLDRAVVRASSRGVLTYVVDEEGMALRQGDLLARVADLTRFRVEATLSDIHASRIHPGMPVEVVVNDSLLQGQVDSILPSLEGGIVKLIVGLDSPSHPLLRSNLRVEVFLIASHVENVLRLKKGPYASGGGKLDMFVVDGKKAVRTPVVLGLTGRNHFEVKRGFEEGERVILSDMSRFQHLESVRVR